ncbi:MAG: D-alanyl-D-alanine carboxypeptidase [Lachnospiraceae bacterium]|nr:D-alanyl-D-alanine carboxypeptidase [Lachnospiraceae bacterium]
MWNFFELAGGACSKLVKKGAVLVLTGVLVFSLTACGKEEIPTSYDIYETSTTYGILNAETAEDVKFFADDLCVTDTSDFGTDAVDSYIAWAAGVFNGATNEVTYSQSIHEHMFPASTTKILTALCVLKYGDLDKKVIVSDLACDQESDSSVANLRPGDEMTERQLLYGLMLRSGNDAAIALAEAVSGDVESFMTLMNNEALSLGATNSHFVTPNGLHDDDHYTTVYDLYLITKEALKYQEFVDMIHTASYDVVYTDSTGAPQQMTWNNTNRYLLGTAEMPEGFDVIGGKTGTTGQAMYCLVLYSTNEAGQPIISIVLGADSAVNLYVFMNEILEGFGH